jgi:hypothetical protein
MSDAGGEDWASVRVATRLSAAGLAAFCRDVERLLRINSMYEFEEWRSDGGDGFFMRVRNLSNGRTIETAIRVQPHADGVRIAYEVGLKTATEFRAEPPAGEGGRGAVLLVTDHYSGTPEAERRVRTAEIDKSLVWWGHDLHRYLRYWARWSGFGPWQWYMRQIWQPMRPKARRIAFILIAITLFEAAVGVLALAIFASGW